MQYSNVTLRMINDEYRQAWEHFHAGTGTPEEQDAARDAFFAAAARVAHSAMLDVDRQRDL